MSQFISNRVESVRMFRNPVMEYFSHIHPITPFVVYTPFILLTAYLGAGTLGPFLALAAFGVGLLYWTILEYSLHRWVFHYVPQSTLGKEFHFVFHGVHHDYPRDHSRLVMPLLFSVPLGIVHYMVFTQIFGEWTNSIYAGLLFGYVSYDTVHYLTHLPPMKNRAMKFLRTYHLRHHYEEGKRSFGVTSPLWDYLLGTLPAYMESPPTATPAARKTAELPH